MSLSHLYVAESHLAFKPEFRCPLLQEVCPTLAAGSATPFSAIACQGLVPAEPHHRPSMLRPFRNTSMLMILFLSCALPCACILFLPAPSPSSISTFLPMPALGSCLEKLSLTPSSHVPFSPSAAWKPSGPHRASPWLPVIAVFIQHWDWLLAHLSVSLENLMSTELGVGGRLPSWV